MLTYFYYFLSVDKNKSITKAAHENHISQPAMSAAISRLEARLGGIKLFERDVMGMTLTPEGECVKRYANAICIMYEKMENELTLLKDHAEGTLRVGGAMRHIVDIIDGFRKIYPMYNVTFTQYNNGYELKNALLDSEIDLCVSAPPIKGVGIHCETLCEEQMYAIFNKNNPLYSKRSICLKDLLDYDIIAQPPLFPLRLIVDELFRNIGAAPKYRMQAENSALYSTINKADAVNYVALFPYSRCTEVKAVYKNLRFGCLEENCKRTIAVSYLESPHMSAPFMPMLEFIKGFYNEDIYNSAGKGWTL